MELVDVPFFTFGTPCASPFSRVILNVWPVVYLIYHFIYITYVACWAGTDDTIATYVQYYEHCPPSTIAS